MRKKENFENETINLGIVCHKDTQINNSKSKLARLNENKMFNDEQVIEDIVFRVKFCYFLVQKAGICSRSGLSSYSMEKLSA